MAQAITDLIGGRIDLAILMVPMVRPMLDLPGVSVLAVATSGARVLTVAQLMAPRGREPGLASRIQQEVAASPPPAYRRISSPRLGATCCCGTAFRPRMPSPP